MVKEYGMSEKLGLMTFERERKPLFLNFDPSPGSKDYSEETAREIDDEIRKIIDQSYIKVKTVLTEKKEILQRVAQILLEKESIDGEALRKILQEYTGEHEDNELREKTD
jgi:cell division protease FtsH